MKQALLAALVGIALGAGASMAQDGRGFPRGGGGVPRNIGVTTLYGDFVDAGVIMSAGPVVQRGTGEGFVSYAASGTCGYKGVTEGSRVCIGPDTYFTESGSVISTAQEVQSIRFTGTSNGGFGITNASGVGIHYGWGTAQTTPGASCGTTVSPAGLNTAISYDGDGWFHVACNNGAATRLSGVINSDTVGVGNVGASGPDDLQTYTLPANVLVHTGRCLRITAVGTTANNGNAKTVRLVAGAGPTVLVSKQLTASVAGTWELNATICRTGSSAQRYWSKASNSGGTTVSTTDGTGVAFIPTVSSTLTETETNTLVVKTQSTTSTADNDIVSNVLTVELL